jgi:hypothetical protein
MLIFYCPKQHFIKYLCHYTCNKFSFSNCLFIKPLYEALNTITGNFIFGL